MNSNWQARWTRIRKLFNGDFRAWADQNIAALRTIEQRLASENRELLQRFTRARQKPLLQRAFALSRLGLYRQTLLRNLGLAAAEIGRASCRERVCQYV